MNPTTRKMTLSGALIALAVSLNYVLASIPNVELMTALIFISGVMLGWKYGLVIAVLAEGLFSAFNPFGPAPLPVLAFQVLGMALPGIAGGLLSTFLAGQGKRLAISKHALLGALGALFSILFDLLTTFGTALAMGFSWAGFLGLLSIGVVFYATHILANAMIFAMIVPILIQTLKNRIDLQLEPAKSQRIEPTPTCDG